MNKRGEEMKDMTVRNMQGGEVRTQWAGALASATQGERWAPF